MLWAKSSPWYSSQFRELFSILAIEWATWSFIRCCTVPKTEVEGSVGKRYQEIWISEKVMITKSMCCGEKSYIHIIMKTLPWSAHWLQIQSVVFKMTANSRSLAKLHLRRKRYNTRTRAIKDGFWQFFIGRKSNVFGKLTSLWCSCGSFMRLSYVQDVSSLESLNQTHNGNEAAFKKRAIDLLLRKISKFDHWIQKKNAWTSLHNATTLLIYNLSIKALTSHSIFSSLSR